MKRYSTLFIALLILLLSSCTGNKQVVYNGKWANSTVQQINVQVFDLDNKGSLPGIEIKMYDDSNQLVDSAITNYDGIYAINNYVDHNIKHLIFSFIGYEDLTIDLDAYLRTNKFTIHNLKIKLKYKF